MPSIMSTYTFIDNTGPITSKRTRELRVAQVRAHAARVVWHERAKRNGREEDSTSLSTNRTELGANDEAIPRAVGQSSLSDEDRRASFFIQLPEPIRIYVDILAPNLYSVYRIFNVRSVWTEEWLPYMATEIFYYAVCATLQTIREGLECGFTPRAPSRRVMRYKDQALRVVRKSLAEDTCASDAALMAVLFLAVIEGRFGRLSVLEMHRKALLELIERRGGLSKINPYVRCILSQFDFFLTTNGRRTLIGPPISFTAFTDVIDYDQLPSGFQGLITKERLSTEVIHAVQRVGQALQKSRNNKKSERIQAQPESAAYDNFWEALPSLGVIQTDNEPQIDSLLSLGLVLYCSLEFSDLPVWQTMMLWSNMIRRIRGNLTSQLLSCRKERDADEENCLQWLCAIALGSWRNADQTLASEGRILLGFIRGRFPEGSRHLAITGRFFDFKQIKFETDRDPEE